MLCMLVLLMCWYDVSLLYHSTDCMCNVTHAVLLSRDLFPQLLMVLFEHAAGYALFRCQDVEEIGALLPEVQEAVLDFARFSQVVQLEAFCPFKTGANALDNINSISEGVFFMNSIHTTITTVFLSHVTYVPHITAYTCTHSYIHTYIHYTHTRTHTHIYNTTH